MEMLLKSETSVTTLVIKNLNETVRKPRIGEKEFNDNISKINKTIRRLTDKL